MPWHGDLPHLPAPKVSPGLPPPRQGMVRLALPAGALLFVNGKQLDAAPEFLTPDLEPGQDYRYEFLVKLTQDGKEVTRVKQVTIRAGAVVRVAYEDMSPADKAETRQVKESRPAHISVRLPEDARLYIDGVFCPLTSDTRAFDTPKLEPGRKYLYVSRAELARDGRQRSETRRVIFRAGEQVTVNFEDLDGNEVGQ